MLTLIKKHLPQPIKRALAPAYQRTIAQWQKRRLFLRMQKKHQALLAQIKGKERIRVVFLVIHKSVWKVDPVFQKMLADPFFDPIILVCPYTAYGDERMRQDMQECLAYFNAKGYPTYSAYNDTEKRWIKLDELTPDIVFFTNPHDLTLDEYYKNAHFNYLGCYVPYAHDVSRYENYVGQYNQIFHNSMWKIFAPHDEDLEIYRMYSQSKGRNVIVTGYPSCEEFFEIKKKSSWKSQENNRIKVIWAPHHTIDDPVLPYSNFLKLANFFQMLSFDLRDKVQFAFKPHPILKSKLFIHPDWGVEKTIQYYEYWEKTANTQLEEGDYVNLFQWSDCMIHDSGSFLAEYHYVKKPVFFIATENVESYLNPFGMAALSSCVIGSSEEEIRCFLEKMIKNEARPNLKFFNSKLAPYFIDGQPSDLIVADIKKSIN